MECTALSCMCDFCFQFWVKDLLNRWMHAASFLLCITFFEDG